MRLRCHLVAFEVLWWPLPLWLLWRLRKRQWGCEKCSAIPHEGLPEPKGVDEENGIRIAARQDVMESAPCSSSPQLWFSHKVTAMVPWKWLSLHFRASFWLLCWFCFLILHLPRDSAKRIGRETGEIFGSSLSLGLPCWALVPLRPLANALTHSRHSANAHSSLHISSGN